MVYSTRRFVLCLTLCHFVLVFSVLLALRLPRLGKKELIVVLFVRLFDLRLFGFVCFFFLLVSGKGCGLWHSLDFSLTSFSIHKIVAEFIAFLCLCVLSDSGTMASENEDRKHNTEKDYEQTVLLEE